MACSCILGENDTVARVLWPEAAGARTNAGQFRSTCQDRRSTVFLAHRRSLLGGRAYQITQRRWRPAMASKPRDNIIRRNASGQPYHLDSLRVDGHADSPLSTACVCSRNRDSESGARRSALIVDFSEELNKRDNRLVLRYLWKDVDHAWPWTLRSP